MLSDAHTLLKTEDISNEIINLDPGKYYRFGLKSQLSKQNNFEGNDVNHFGTDLFEKNSCVWNKFNLNDELDSSSVT